MCPCRPTASLKGQGEAFSANGLFRLRIGLFGQRVNRAVRLLDFGVVKSGAYLRAHTVKIFFAQQRLLPELLLSKGGAFFKAGKMIYKTYKRVLRERLCTLFGYKLHLGGFGGAAAHCRIIDIRCRTVFGICSDIVFIG